MLPEKNNKGFTLIEVLLAIFIFAVVISMIFTAYTGAIRIMNETETQSAISRMARIALERMTEDLEAAYMSSWVKTEAVDGTGLSGRFKGENDEIDGWSADRIRFLSRARVVFGQQDTGAGGPAEISYYLIKDEEQEGLILYRSETPVLEASPEEGTGGLEIGRGLRSVEITYLNENGEVLEEWDSSSLEYNNLLPRVVSIILSFWDRSGEEESVYLFRTRAALPLSRDRHGQIP